MESGEGLMRRRWLLRPALALAVCASAGGAILSFPVLARAETPVVVGEEEWVTEVSASSATLQARVNPDGTATTYEFEYEASDGEVSMSPEGEAGSGTEGVVVQVHPQDLKADTVYRFRVIVENADGKEAGAYRSFTTQQTGGELTLPDGRAWELVSPATKDGALIESSEEHGGVVQAAEGGGAITYLSIGPVESPMGNSNVTQVLSVRNTGGGWASRDIATRHNVTTGISYDAGQEYRYFSPDLSVGLAEPLGSGGAGKEPTGAALLSPAASEMTVYLRADAPLSPDTAEKSAYSEAVAEGGYLPLVTGCPQIGKVCKPGVEKRANVLPRGKEFGGKIEFVGATADLSHVVLDSLVPLAEKTLAGAPNEGEGLYEWSGGQLQLVSVLPNGEQEHGAFLGGTEGYNARGAISNEGSRIVWSAHEHLFMRDIANEQTIQLDAVQGGSGNGSEPQALFQFANSDGSKIFFTDEEDLTADSTARFRKPDLYECEMVETAGELSCTLSDLTVDPGGHATVRGMVAAGSEEDSDIYFVANGVLTSTPNAQGKTAEAGDCAGGGNAEAGQTCNLYVLHDDGTSWTTTFIASLSGTDKNDWGEKSSFFGNLEGTASMVSSNGRYLVFMSDQSLTGYDNADASSGEADEEVYSYDVQSGSLACVSCNPTGEQPSGVLDSPEARGGEGLLVDTQNNWKDDRWLAGVVPGWTAMKEAVARYQPRYLTDSGRVFFDSPDALVPQDTNELMDVYEYEPEGIPADSPYMCTKFSVTFGTDTGGCVGLISSGSSGEESVFLDASGKSPGASGTGPGEEEAEDVFFLTSAPLVPADKDTAFDVYDAHVCSLSAPCSAEAVSPPPCTTEASCKAAPSPQPSIFGASGSATFSGTGNIAPPLIVTATKCSKGKLHGGKCVKTKTKSKHKAKAKKSSNDRRGKR